MLLLQLGEQLSDHQWQIHLECITRRLPLAGRCVR